MCLDKILNEPLPDEVECYMFAHKEPGPRVKRAKEGDWVLDTLWGPVTGRVVRYKDGKLTYHGLYLIERDDGEGWYDESLTPSKRTIYHFIRPGNFIKLSARHKPIYFSSFVKYPCPIGKEVVAEEPELWELTPPYSWGFHRFEEITEQLRENLYFRKNSIVRGVLKDIVAVGLQEGERVYVGRRWTSLEEV